MADPSPAKAGINPYLERAKGEAFDPQEPARSADDDLTPVGYAKEWLTYAEMDLATVEFLLAMYPLPIAIICYHCQQSAEKCLKGLLTLKKSSPA